MKKSILVISMIGIFLWSQQCCCMNPNDSREEISLLAYTVPNYETETSSHLAIIPDEVMMVLFNFLPAEDLLQVRGVSTRFAQLFESYFDNILWLQDGQTFSVVVKNKEAFSKENISHLGAFVKRVVARFKKSNKKRHFTFAIRAPGTEPFTLEVPGDENGYSAMIECALTMLQASEKWYNEVNPHDISYQQTMSRLTEDSCEPTGNFLRNRCKLIKKIASYGCITLLVVYIIGSLSAIGISAHTFLDVQSSCEAGVPCTYNITAQPDCPQLLGRCKRWCNIVFLWDFCKAYLK